MSVYMKLKAVLLEKRLKRNGLKTDADADLKHILSIFINSVYLDPVDIDIEKANKLTVKLLASQKQLKKLDADMQKIREELGE